MLPTKGPKKTSNADTSRCVLIDATALSEEEFTLLVDFLQEDPAIESVNPSSLNMRSDYPPSPQLPNDGYILEIQAAAEPVWLSVSFLAATASTVAQLTSLGKHVDYLIEKIKTLRNRHGKKFAHVPIYDAEGNVVRMVKQKLHRAT
jgi:hypothetical protein